MALTDKQLEVISEALLPLFQHLEQEVIVDVANRIKESMAYTRTAELEVESMQKLGYSPARIRKEAMKILESDAEFRKMVAKNTLEHKKKVKKLLREITKAAQDETGKILTDVGDMSYFDDLRIWKEGGKELTDNSFLPQLVDAMRQQLSGNLQNLTKTTGFKTMSGFEAMESLYQKELDKAIIKVSTGTFSKEQIVYDVVHNLASSGLRSIDFASGRSMQLDTAVRLAMRTGAHQLAGKITDQNIIRMKENLVRISTHRGARNTGPGHANHEQWQGKVYFIKEGNDYSKEAVRIGQNSITSLWHATGYSVDGEHENDPLGLYGYNCRHRHYPWFEGISTFPKVDEELRPVTIKGKTYDYYGITQKQRSMERSIRALKREREAMNALEMETKEISGKIKRKIREYEEFCESAKVDAKINRLRYECGTSDLKKTKAWKAFKTISEEGEQGDIMGVVRGIFSKVYDHKPIKISELPTLHANRINLIIDSAPQDVRKFTLDNIDKVGIINEKYLGRAHNTSKGIRFNINKQVTDKRGSYTTFFHELGHNLDMQYGDISVLHVFKTSLQNDFDDVVNSYCKYYNVSRDTAFIEIGKSISGHKFHSISDLCGGMSDNKCIGTYGHEDEYWGKKPNALETEAFAHFYEATIRNDVDKLHLIKQMFPNAYKIFEDMLR